VILHRALRELDRHATAEELARAVEDRLPNLSPPTVYATLELFEELGVVRRIAGGPGPVLWDPRPEEHQHFACRRCGRVLDLDVRLRATSALDAARSAGHAPDSAQLLVVGVCDECRREV
jgi:Fe2+ or Zn2+ uptake regulation protein